MIFTTEYLVARTVWPWANATGPRHWIRRRELHQRCWWPQCWCVWFHPGAEQNQESRLSLTCRWIQLNTLLQGCTTFSYYVHGIHWNTLKSTIIYNHIIINSMHQLWPPTNTIRKLNTTLAAIASYLGCQVLPESQTILQKWKSGIKRPSTHLDTSGSSWSLKLSQNIL